MKTSTLFLCWEEIDILSKITPARRDSSAEQTAKEAQEERKAVEGVNYNRIQDNRHFIGKRQNSRIISDLL